MLRIRNTNSYIVTNPEGYKIGVSYNTPIAAATGGITYYSENVYSNTTAHHKSDIIRIFNNASNIEVKQAALIDLINNDIKPIEIIGEETQKQLLTSKILKESKYNAIAENEAYIQNKELIKEHKTHYKNGNYKVIRKYKTTFKYVSNFYFKETVHYFKTKIIKNGRKLTYYKPKKWTVISSY